MENFTEGVNEFTGVSHNLLRVLKKLRRYQIIHGGGYIIHGCIR